MNRHSCCKIICLKGWAVSSRPGCNSSWKWLLDHWAIIQVPVHLQSTLLPLLAAGVRCGGLGRGCAEPPPPDYGGPWAGASCCNSTLRVTSFLSLRTHTKICDDMKGKMHLSWTLESGVGDSEWCLSAPMTRPFLSFNWGDFKQKGGVF